MMNDDIRFSILSGSRVFQKEHEIVNADINAFPKWWKNNLQHLTENRHNCYKFKQTELYKTIYCGLYCGSWPIHSFALRLLPFQKFCNRKNGEKEMRVWKLTENKQYLVNILVAKANWDLRIKIQLLLLPPANEILGKVIFSEACVKNSVHRGGLLPGGAWSQGVWSWWGIWSQGVCFQGGAWWKPPRDGYCCGRYSGYWNVFL